MSLLFNTLSRFVIDILSRSKGLSISWLQYHTQWFWSPRNSLSVLPLFPPSICYEVMGSDAMISVFWILSFKPAFSFSSFTLIKRFFTSSLLSAIRVVSSAYLRWLIFLPAVLIPACDSPRPVFHIMYSAYKLSKQGDIIQPCHIPFPSLTSQLFYVQFYLLLLDLHTGFSEDW